MSTNIVKDATTEHDERVACQNTDKEIWRERPDDYYADSIHVTESGAIGINCGGYVKVMPVRDWFALAAIPPVEAVDACLSPTNNKNACLSKSGDFDNQSHKPVSDEEVIIVIAKGLRDYNHRQVEMAAVGIYSGDAQAAFQALRAAGYTITKG